MSEIAFVHPYKALCHHAEKIPNSPALAGLCLGEATFEDFHVFNWAQTLEKVQQYALVLRGLGLEKGDRLAFQSCNQISWVLLDWACASIGVVSVPLYVQSLESEIHYILEESAASYFISERNFFEAQTPHLSFADLEKRSLLMDVGEFVEAISSADDTLTIIYTSGTTGEPKGVVHSLHNMFLATQTAQHHAKVSYHDRHLSYLPLSHVVERVLCAYMSIYFGSTIYFVDQVEKVAKLLPRIQPTIFAAVPRIWDLIRHKVERELKNHPFAKWLPRPIRNRVLGSAVRKKLGFNKTRLLVSGAAKLSVESADFFASLGLPIIEGYGLTETCGISFMNIPGNPKSGTVGKQWPGVEVKLAEDGEILLKADHHFQGYYLKEDLTNQVLKDGWFYTGDIGKFDDNGNLMITDRKKDIFKTTNGKYVAPQPIELAFKKFPEIFEIMVYGENQPHCVALVSLAEPEVTYERLREIMKDVNAHLASFQKIHALGVTRNRWTPESGELTPSMKLKRRQIQERYAQHLKDLYIKREPVVFIEEGAFFFQKEQIARVDSRIQ